MNRSEAEKIFNAVGGKKKLIAWAKLNAANYGQLLSLLGRSVLQDGVDDAQHAAPTDPAIFAAQAQAALLGVITARSWPGVGDVANVDVNIRPGVSDGNSQTPSHGITNTTAPQALLPSKPDVAQHAVVVRKRSEPVVPGIGAAQALGEGGYGQRSATEMFYEHAATARPTWSPGRDWSGS
jgi:hypothetical protein